MSLRRLSQLNNKNLNNLLQNNSFQSESLQNNSFQSKSLQNNYSNNGSNYSVLNSSNKNINPKNISKKIKKEKSYELVDFPEEGQSYGTYKGTTPKQAAKKAFSKLARSSNLNNSNQKFIVFVIRSKIANKNGIKREFKYMGQRVKLERGIEIKRGNKIVTIKYKNIVNKFKNLNH